MTTLELNNLTAQYTAGGYVVRPIEDFSLRCESGEMVLLLGPSGCGKTTLLSCLAGILAPADGSIHVGSTDVAGLVGEALTEYRRHTVGIVFQAFNLIPSLTALENVSAPLWADGIPRRTARERAAQLLAQVALTERAGHRPGDLSGGQQQRVAIARALVHDPPLLLADEPTAHLDYIQVDSVLTILRQLAQPGRLLVVATHDERMVPLADRVVELKPHLVAPSRTPVTESYVAGQVIFEQGSRGALIYVVEQGEVEIVRQAADGGEERLAVSHPGDYFGELGPLLGFPRSATARAATDTTLVGYTARDFRNLLGDDGVAERLGRHSAARRMPTP